MPLQQVVSAVAVAGLHVAHLRWERGSSKSSSSPVPLVLVLRVEMRSAATMLQRALRSLRSGHCKTAAQRGAANLLARLAGQLATSLQLNTHANHGPIPHPQPHHTMKSVKRSTWPEALRTISGVTAGHSICA